MRTSNDSRTWSMRAAAIVAAVFGIATMRVGGSVLFGDGAQAASNVVGFVLWFNFLAGFAYVAAGAGLWMRRRWGALIAAAIAVSTQLVFAAFGIHVALGGAYDTRTVWAMTLRSVVWILIALFALRALKSQASPPATRAVATARRDVATGSQ